MKNLILFGASLIIHATGYAQLQNTDFEAWVNPITNTISANRPVGWVRGNGLPNNPYINFYHPPTTAAQNGNYALSMSIWYTYDLDMAKQVAPINYRPASLTGFYSYTDNQVYDQNNMIINDEAKVTVTLTKVDSTTGNKILVGSGISQLSTANTYTPFTCVINYLSNDIPDTIEVEFDCSLMDKLNGPVVTPISQASISSILTIDNISLTPQSLSTTDFALTSINVYPNPTFDIVNFPAFDGMLKVYDVTGKTVVSGKTNSGSIDISRLVSGTYIFSFTNDKGTFNTKVIKK